MLVTKKEISEKLGLVVGFGGWWYTMITSPNPNHLFSSVLFLIALIYLVATIRQFISLRWLSGVVSVLIFVGGVGGETWRIIGEIRNAPYCYGILVIPVTELTGPFVLSIAVHGDSPINNLTAEIMDVSGVDFSKGGEDATDILRNSKSIRIPIVYPLPTANETTLQFERRRGTYLINIDTQIGAFQETLKVNETGQTVTLIRIKDDKVLLKDFYAVGQFPKTP